MKAKNIPDPVSSETQSLQPARLSGGVDRRSFLKGLGVAGVSLAPATALLIREGEAKAQEVPPGLAQSDLDILRFLAATEILEADIWEQYLEFAVYNPAYSAGLRNLNRDMVQYVLDNNADEASHQKFLNAFLVSAGSEAVSLDEFRTLTGSQAAGSKQLGRLTNLTQLNVDTGWYTWCRSTGNPDFGDSFKGPISITNQPAIPINDTDTPPATDLTPPISTPHALRVQAIANTATFHFASVERCISSLYASLIPKASGLVVLQILAAIGGSEVAHFQTWHEKVGHAVSKPLAGVTDPVTGLKFPDLNSPAFGGEFAFQTNLIMPEPCSFVSKDLPDCSIIRPTLEANAGPLAVVDFFTKMGLFKGQTPQFFETLTALAGAAKKAQRQ